MLVDDAEISNFIMKKLIIKAGIDASIYDYTNPRLALEALDTVVPDLIFLDINMPDIDGWNFLQVMADQKQHYPVLMLTSSTSEMDKQRSLAYSNVKAFLIKPLLPQHIGEIIAWHT